MDSSNIMKTGTTTVGIVCKDSVVLAADMRATIGHLIGDTDIDKVVTVSDNIALTTAGSVSAIQLLVKYLQSELKLRKIKSGRETTVKEAANLLRNWVYGIIRQPSMMPDVAHLLMAGADKYGVHLYEIFPDGSLLKNEEFRFSGSGSYFALGVLESEYKKGMTTEQGIALAEKCIDVAIQRDSASGNGVNVFVIDKDGARKVSSKKVDTHLKQVQIN